MKNTGRTRIIAHAKRFPDVGMMPAAGQLKREKQGRFAPGAFDLRKLDFERQK
jgi:hypothetical protein